MMAKKETKGSASMGQSRVKERVPTRARIDRSDVRDIAPDEQSARKAETKRQKRASLKTYGDLLRATYAHAGRLKLTKSQTRAIHTGPVPESAEREQLLALASSDRALKRTRELMLLGVKELDGSTARQPVREFVRAVMLRHPAYRSRSLVAALEHPDSSDDKHAVHIISGLKYDLLRWPGNIALPKKDVNTCRVNALHCLLLWYSETRNPQLSPEAICRHLHNELWAIAGQPTDDSERVRVLMENRSPEAMVLVDALREDRVKRLKEEIKKWSEQYDEARVTAERVKVALADAEHRLKGLQAKSDRLTETLKQERNDRAVKTARLRDDYEKLRSRNQRRLERELSLLKEGLLALRRQPPKVDVMDDHVDRAITGLSEELELLQRG